MGVKADGGEEKGGPGEGIKLVSHGTMTLSRLFVGWSSNATTTIFL